jgi:hypothetical protein
MFTTEEQVDHKLNKAVTMSLEAFDVNKTRNEVLLLKNMNKNSDHKRQEKSIKTARFMHKKMLVNSEKRSNIKANATIKKTDTNNGKECS